MNRHTHLSTYILLGMVLFLIVAFCRLDKDIKTVNYTLNEHQESISELSNKVDDCTEKLKASEVEKLSYYDVDLSTDIQDYLFTECEKREVDAVLILALIKTESNFTSDIISSTGDYGLMQINKVNHSWLQEELGTLDFLDAKDNIKAGVYMLSRIKQSELSKKLMVYNMGGSQAKALWSDGVYSTEYTDTVKDNMNYIQKREVVK